MKICKHAVIKMRIELYHALPEERKECAEEAVSQIYPHARGLSVSSLDVLASYWESLRGGSGR